jgi:hypothetical protein
MAATEWLRKERDAIIRENTNPLAYLYLKVRILAALNLYRIALYLSTTCLTRACDSCCLIESECCSYYAADDILFHLLSESNGPAFQQCCSIVQCSYSLCILNPKVCFETVVQCAELAVH